MMNISARLGVGALMCTMSLAVFAQSEQPPLSRSIGKVVGDDSTVLRRALKSQNLDEGVVVDTQVEGGHLQNKTANRFDQYFSIYDADIALLSDIDGDGFHHALNVRFDVDVDYGGATVYAKLYLSREGGPWIQYNTTDLFNIFEDEISDTYEVTTELVDGYPAGYYALLVEIYSLNHAGMVASEIFDHHNIGNDIMLEDLHRDEVIFYEEVTVTTVHGGGSFTLFFWLLLVQVVIAARGALTLSPRKTIIIKKGTSGLRSFLPANVANTHSTR